LETIEHFCPYKPTIQINTLVIFLVTSISSEAAIPYYNNGLAAEIKTKTIDFGGALFRPASRLYTRQPP
jgi:hypothetical protein